jgi:hypothetical protein
MVSVFSFFDDLKELSFWIIYITELLMDESNEWTMQARRRQAMWAYKRLKPLANAHDIKSKGLWLGIYYSLFDESYVQIQDELVRLVQARPKYSELFTGTRAERAVKCSDMLKRKYDNLVNNRIVNPRQLL